jgi:DNA-binding response OmpR family regulator
MNGCKPLAVVCDDSATLALQLSRMLEALGFAVQVCDPSELNLPLQPEPALICVELLGTNSNGFKLLRRLAAHHQCPQLLLTATGRSTDYNCALRTGATAVLPRPFTLQQLQRWALPVSAQETAS